MSNLLTEILSTLVVPLGVIAPFWYIHRARKVSANVTDMFERMDDDNLDDFRGELAFDEAVAWAASRRDSPFEDALISDDSYMKIDPHTGIISHYNE